jgi:hypothetical protein
MCGTAQTMATRGRTRRNTSTLTPPIALRAELRAATFASKCFALAEDEAGAAAGAFAATEAALGVGAGEAAIVSTDVLGS